MEPFFIVYFIALSICATATFLGYWYDVFDPKSANPYPLLFIVTIAPYINVIIGFNLILALILSLIVKLINKKDEKKSHFSSVDDSVIEIQL